MTDNSAALQRARRREGQAKRRRALAALQAMAEAGEAIGFPAVARRAGVSVSLLYADRDLLARIGAAELETDNARLRQQVGQLEADTSELADNLDAAREMNRELMNEVNRRAAALAGAGRAEASGRRS